MKKLLPILLLFLLALASCKKEKTPAMGTTPTTFVTVTGISPATVSAGMVVTITGTNFGTDTAGVKVSFNGVAGVVQSVTNTEIKAVVPVTTSGNVTIYIGSQISTGAAFIYTTYTVPLATATALSPASGTVGTVVTITGTNFGTSANGVSVLFNGKAGTVQAVTPTEIKVVAPVTTSGNVAITVSGQTITGPVFTYVDAALTAAYVSGDVTLNSQAEVDTFIALNKGRRIQITGSLSIGDITNDNSDITSIAGLSNITSISGGIGIQNCPNLTTALFLNTITTVTGIAISNSGLTKLSFNNIQSFTGNFQLTNLNSLNHVDFNGLKTVDWLYLSSCPLLVDLSFLKDITSVKMFNLNFLAATTITMDKLTGTLAGSQIYVCNNLTNVSFKSLTTIPGGLTLMYCPQLASADFGSLSSISGKLTLYNTNLADLSGFSSLATLGALSIYNNPALVTLRGLEHVTALTAVATNPGTAPSLYTRLNGIYIANNAKLASLTGLENVTSLPIIYISSNSVLNDFCPLKTPIVKLNTSAPYSYAYRDQVDRTITVSMPALTLANNSNYETTKDALAAVALCK